MVFQGGNGKGKAGKGGTGGKGAYDAGKGCGKLRKGGKRGFKGSCYNCGKAGHIAAHCRQANAVSEKSENEDELEAPVGGVWMVGHVDATTAGCENGCACEGGWKSVRRARRRFLHVDFVNLRDWNLRTQSNRTSNQGRCW